ncbi:hypothetical protein C8R43DRAFT_994870 [Mycena crocata]|nr:hypothetical protein C8R43DRAFT_994870 [Mycena crocata]
MNLGIKQEAGWNCDSVLLLFRDGAGCRCRLIQLGGVRGAFQSLACAQRWGGTRARGRRCLGATSSGVLGRFSGVLCKVRLLGLGRDGDRAEDHERFTRLVDLVLLLARDLPLLRGAPILLDILVKLLLHVWDEMEVDDLRGDRAGACVDCREVLEERGLRLIQRLVSASRDGSERPATDAIVVKAIRVGEHPMRVKPVVVSASTSKHVIEW